MIRGSAGGTSDEYARGGAPEGQRPETIRATREVPDDAPVVDGEESPDAAEEARLGELARQVVAAQPRRAGRRRSVPTERREGRYVRARLPRGSGDLALDATLRAAAPAQPARRRAGPGLAVRIVDADLREKQRARKVGRLLVFLVDASGSMGTELLALARNAAGLLLEEAYLRRDRVAMVAFRGERAELLFAPTASVEAARRRLGVLPTGGKTPLAFGLIEGYEVVRRALLRDAQLEPVIVLLSDCKANVGTRPGYAAILAELDRIAAALRAQPRLRVVLLDATEDGKNDQAARELAAALAATRIEIHRLRALRPAELRELLRRI